MLLLLTVSVGTGRTFGGPKLQGCIDHADIEHIVQQLFAGGQCHVVFTVFVGAVLWQLGLVCDRVIGGILVQKYSRFHQSPQN
jgi:hypothetical protein